jgi:hypothetical protein
MCFFYSDKALFPGQWQHCARIGHAELRRQPRHQGDTVFIERLLRLAQCRLQPIRIRIGFTLIAVLITFAVLAGVLSVAYCVYFDGLRRVSRSAALIKATVAVKLARFGWARYSDDFAIGRQYLLNAHL